MAWLLLYRLFGSKRGILSAVLEFAFGGVDEPIEFQERPAVRAALAEPDPGRLPDAFDRTCRELLDRSAAVQRVLAGPPQSTPKPPTCWRSPRQQRHLGQSRVVRALAEREAPAERLTDAEAADIVYTVMSLRCIESLRSNAGGVPTATKTGSPPACAQVLVTGSAGSPRR
jgi:AcrR family transcriptional regulator